MVCSTDRPTPVVRQQQPLRAVLADGGPHQVRVIRKQTVRRAKVFRGQCGILLENPCERRRVTVRLATLIQGGAQSPGQPVALRQPLRGVVAVFVPQFAETLKTVLAIGAVPENTVLNAFPQLLMGERRARGGIACVGGRPLKFWLGLRPVRQIHEGILDDSLQTTEAPRPTASTRRTDRDGATG